MFRRKPTDTAVVDTVQPKPGGKGRPTPSRKEAEAAARARAKRPVTRKEQAAAARAQRATTSQKMREAMKTGDERYLPARDRGPVRRFVRDYVDTKFTVAELMIPLMVVTMIVGWSSTELAYFANAFLTLVLLIVVVNLVILRIALHRQLKARFPDQSRRGLTYYAVVRALQLRILRMPRPQVKVGQALPDTYR